MVKCIKNVKWLGCSNVDNDKTEIREVSFPLSKNRLAQFDIPKDFRIVVWNYSERWIS
ncbi:MAG: hypothetical protein WCI04_00275 [archaeon]